MTHRRPSLLRTLFKSLLLPGILAALLGVFIVYNLTKEEYDELQDASLISKAHLLLKLAEAGNASAQASFLSFETDILSPEERSVYWFLDNTGQVAAHSPEATPDLLPSQLTNGMITANNHRFAIVSSGDKRTVVVGIPMDERNEAITDVLIGVVLGFLLLGVLFSAAAFRAVRKSSRTIAKLSENIASKDEHDLSPINRHNSFAEIDPAIDTLDTLMARLDTALAAERAFATNAAHELRTPVAIALAHAQRLKAQLAEPSLANNAAEIEQGLKRLARLIERLLQMSRAQSGLGTTPAKSDVRPVISMLLSELRQREPSEDRLALKEPTGIWPSRVDRDALGIILNNLFDNALKYASGPMPTVVDASQPGQITVSNDCEALSPSDLEAIQHRFVRKETKSEGFGLGLAIVQQLCNQSGCTLEIHSPQTGRQRGFTAVLTLPPE
ncbi:sensor histidine kinase [Lentibacter sp. XHP0401]|jgi:two-component system, OmpR family, sensor kinase|uniref:sensor histidine kinase n=1 Tax=Lentibacter sp. XHP0401 TaxID=2984334 RepID=UPI0021E8EFB1|nr:HAMP domain-containing sensor histidine kinase [Lentibacter sp. XHP0401]MCV2892459.1 HAMP domain-containing histidine kinase [Lentibacter sp. XHP0401]